jgi:hypothetical protein
MILVIAAGLKVWLFSTGSIPFNSDEAVVALMARHILQGERPVFFYGQAYMGSLDAFLVSLGFSLFGQQVWVIRMIQTLLYLGSMVTTFALGNLGFKSAKVGLVAAGLMAIPAVNTSLYTTVSLGGYGEALFIGCLILLVSLALIEALGPSANPNEKMLPVPGLCALLGGLVGLGLWAFSLSLIFGAAAFLAFGIFVIRNHPRIRLRLGAGMAAGFVAGFIVGSGPWWVYAFQHGMRSLILEMGGSAVAIETSGFMGKIVNHALNYSLLGLTAALGLRPPWEVRWLALPLLPLALIAWIGMLGFTFRRALKSVTPIWVMLWGVILIQGLAFLLTPFGIDPSGRYFLPLIVPFALMGGVFFSEAPIRKELKWAALSILIIFQAVGNLQCATINPPGISTQFSPETGIDHHFDGELIQFLKTTGETRGYTNYWVSYPLAFLSKEELIFTPVLPYHQDLGYTPRDDRYALYDNWVRSSPRVALITTGQPALENKIRSDLRAAGTEWMEQKIGDYHVFYHLSQKPVLNLTP